VSLLERAEDPRSVRALPEEALPALCADLREEIIQICGRTGGHLGASLGAVELIVALHRVFKSPRDKLVFDVGHQAYAHKLLTGRRRQMEALRQAGGASPFTDPKESPHDAAVAGHAGTAISVACGWLQAVRHQSDPPRVVAVVGDGSLTSGLAFEGLNNAGASRAPFVLALNDNQMSISVNVGAVSELLRDDRARAFFESLGFTYLGPVDGHDVGALIRAFREARQALGPVVVHVKTEKGRGFAPAEGDASTRGHAMGPYEWRDGKLVRSRDGRKTYSEAFAAALEERMARDPRVVAVTPAMLEGSALNSLAARFPDRVFDVGIAEQHAVAFSAGLAAAGRRPVCCIYSTFLQRAYDQVIHDVCVPGLPVAFAVDRAGLVGADGATHQGTYDAAFLRALPGMKVAAAVTGEDLGELLDVALGSPGPMAIRFPRSTLPAAPPELERARGQAAGARWLRRVQRPAGVIVTLGPAALWAIEANVPDWEVLDARYLAPLDGAKTLEAARSGKIVVVEEGTGHGGLASAVLELLAAEGVSARVRCIGMPDAFVPHGDARAQRAALGLDAEGIRRAARALA
jgi:1-deoxy-D-xylulose-5-phosphate synthase